MRKLIRLETINYGVCYFYADQIAIIAFSDPAEQVTNVAVRIQADRCLDLKVAGDPDEIALLLEKHADVTIVRID